MNTFDQAVDRLPQLYLDNTTKAQHQLMLVSLPSDTAPENSRRPRLRLLIAAGAILAIGGTTVGTAAALGAFTQQPSNRGIGSCYTAADLDAQHGEFVVSTPDGPPGDAAAVALELCASSFGTGFYSSTDPDYRNPMVDPNGPLTQPIPPLIPCVMNDGSVGVFPGNTDTCADLGLPVADLSTSPPIQNTR